MPSSGEIFKLINDYLYKKHDIYFATQESNWYTDLGLNDFDRHELFDLLKKQYNIKQMPLNYFSSLGVLCKAIEQSLKDQEIKKQNKFIIWIQSTIQRVKAN